MIDGYIRELMKKQQLVQDIIQETHFNEVSDSDVDIIEFVKYCIDSGLASSTIIAQKIADRLQLLNSSQYYNQISLEQIGQLYKELIILNPYDLLFYESAFHFYDVVMDDNITANKLLRDGLAKITDKTEKLQRLI